MPARLRIAAAVLFYAAVYAFWLFVHPEALTFREQYQMFLTTPGYLACHALTLGGMADYVSEAITQFFFYPAAGAALLTLIFASIQGGVWRLSRQMGAGESSFGLSFIAPLAAMCAMGDERVKVSFLVALAASVWAAAAYARLSGRRLAWQVVAMPCVYWLIGPAVAVYAVVCLSVDARGGRWAQGAWPVVYLAGLMALASATILSFSPVSVSFATGCYVSSRFGVQSQLIAAEAICALAPIAAVAVRGYITHLRACAATAVIIIIGSWTATSFFDAKKYTAIRLEQLVRSGKWDEVLTRAEKGGAGDEVSQTCVNLALAMKGQLLERMFEFRQSGPGGLLFKSRKDQTSAVPTAEALFRLGMVNSAQHYFFDAQESIDDYRKSGRLTRRIAETLIVNGRYETARKHIEKLKHTLFYSRWASEAESLLGDEAAIASHPVYGRMRAIRHKATFFMNYYEMDKMLGQLYMGNRTNKMALDYYMAQCMLRRDIGGVMAGLGWVRETYGDDAPRHVQEAVAMAWGQTHESMDGAPIKISPDVVRRMTDFVGRRRAGMDDTDHSSFWHYMLSSARHDATTGATSRTTEEQAR